MKHPVFASAALIIAATGLSACGQDAPKQVEATPEGFPGVSVTNARLVLPAVTGNPGVLYFDVAYDGDRAAALRSVSVTGSENSTMHDYIGEGPNAEMGEILPQTLEKGTALSFEPGGKHVMVMGLDEGLAAGGKTEATLTFAGGDKTSFEVNILGPGDER